MGCGSSTNNTANQPNQQASDNAEQSRARQHVPDKPGLCQPVRKVYIDDMSEANERPIRQGHYKNNGPADICLAPGVEEEALFDPGSENQLYFYKLNDERDWYYYNDSLDRDAFVDVLFGPQSVLEKSERTQLEELPRGNRYTLLIHPGETLHFVSGTVNGVQAEFQSRDLEPEYAAAMLAKNAEDIENAIARVKAIAGDTEDVEQVLKACIKNNVQFIDYIHFPPREVSIYRPGIDKQPSVVPGWAHPHDYLPQELHKAIRLFGKVEADDINQGALGDCYFLCALASLAEFPTKVVDAFMHPTNPAALRSEHKVGAYRVTMNVGGWWQSYLIDSYSPSLCRQPYYAHNRHDQAELWVQLFEKAFARVHGSYAAIAGGDALQVLSDLTGYPYLRIDEHIQDSIRRGTYTLFDRMSAWDHDNAMITLSTPSKASIQSTGRNESAVNAMYKSAGLVLNHGYSVLKVVQCDENRLLKIRNPWGDGTEWSGPWGDKDWRWNKHPATAKLCGHVEGGAKDGTFWMQWDDVLKYFNSGGVCFLKFNWFDYRIRAHSYFGIPDLAIEVTVEHRVNAFLCLSQNDPLLPQDDDDDADAAEEQPEEEGGGLVSFLIAVTRREGNKQRVHLHTTLDTDEPSPDPLFINARDISMRYSFMPEFSPYLIVPRIYEEHEKDFVMSLITEYAAGDGIDIRFKNIPQACPIFSNYLAFDYDDKLWSDYEVEYQYNPEVGPPITTRGLRIAPGN